MLAVGEITKRIEIMNRHITVLGIASSVILDGIRPNVKTGWIHINY